MIKSCSQSPSWWKRNERSNCHLQFRNNSTQLFQHLFWICAANKQTGIPYLAKSFKDMLPLFERVWSTKYLAERSGSGISWFVNSSRRCATASRTVTVLNLLWLLLSGVLDITIVFHLGGNDMSRYDVAMWFRVVPPTDKPRREWSLTQHMWRTRWTEATKHC